MRRTQSRYYHLRVPLTPKSVRTTCRWLRATFLIAAVGAVAVLLGPAGQAHPAALGTRAALQGAEPLATGPQRGIRCPSSALDIWPGTSIPSIVSLHPAGTTFCLRAGVHSMNSSITPKTGNTFIGEYGAILDGTGWTTLDDTEAAFRAHNQDIDYVIIRNVVIRNFRRGIHAFASRSDHWTIEYNEVTANDSGVVFPSDSVVRNNYIHHNPSGAYRGVAAHNSLLDGNEIAYNGWEQKIAESRNLTFRNNFVHHNTGAGIWYDNNNTGAVVEGNRVDDNGHVGIWYEISSGVIIRNNIIRRNADIGVFISTSKNGEIYRNTLEENFRGILYFVNCASVGGDSIGFDLANNTAYNNTITVGDRVGALANGVTYTSCTSAEAEPYLSGSKRLTFFSNTYHVPSASEWYWFWDRPLHWGQWQSAGQDVEGRVLQ